MVTKTDPFENESGTRPDPLVSMASHRVTADASAPQVGRFRVLGLVGTGGMGEVFSGHDPVLDRLVAIKRLRADRVQNSERRERLQHEARTSAKLSHRNIVTVYDFVHHGGDDHIITEYVDGRSLRDLTMNGRPSLERALEMLVGVAEGLRCAHEHREPVVHRDLKTENVLVATDGTVKIADFGIAHSLGRGERFATGRPSGTVRAMSPEQSFGSVTDVRSDLFSFGTMIYEVVSGVSPFEGSTNDETVERIRSAPHRPLADWVPGLLVELGRLVDRLLQKNAADRPRSVAEVLVSLRGLAAAQRDERIASRHAPQIERRQLAVIHLRDETPGLEAHEHSAERAAEFHQIVAGAAARVPAMVVSAVGREAIVAIGHPQSHENNAVRASAFVAEVFARTGAVASRVRAALDVGDASIVTTRTGSLLVGGVVDGAMRMGRAALGEDFVVSVRAQPLLARHLRLVARAARAGAQAGPHYEVVGSLDERTDVGGVALLGRQRELGFLRSAWGAAADGAVGRVLAIVGEPGIGKSRLAHELMRDGAAHGRWSLAHATPRLRFTPFAVARALVEQLLDLEAESDRGARRMRIGAFVSALAGGGEDVIAATAHVCDVAEAADLERLAAVPPRLRPTFVQDQITQLLVGIAEQRPVALAIEDLHWLDHASLQVVDALVQRADRLPLFVLFTYRSEWQPPWGSRAGVVDITLRRLSEADSRELVGRIADGRQLADSIVDAIVTRAEGVPLVVEELTRAVLAGDAAPADVPTSLRDSVVARLQLLDHTARSIVDTAAVLGREVDADLLGAVLEMSADELAIHVESVVRRGLLEHRHWTKRRGWAFGHVLTRDAVHDALDRSRRVALHARTAAVLESAALDPRGGVSTDSLAHHYEKAEQWERAIELRVRAGGRATERLAHALARAEYERALDLLARHGDLEGRDDRERAIRGALTGPLGATLGWGAPEVERNAARLQELVARSDEELPWTALWQEWALGYVTGNMSIVSAAFGRLDERLRREPRGPAEAAERELVRYLLAGGRGATYVHLGLFGRAREHLVAARRQRSSIMAQLEAFPQLEARLVPSAYLAWVELLQGDLEAAWRVILEEETSETLGAPGQLCAKAFAVPVALVARDWRAAEERAKLVTTLGLDLLAPQHVSVARFALRLIELRRLAQHTGATDLVQLREILAGCTEHFEAWRGGFMRASAIAYPAMVAEGCVEVARRPGTTRECRELALAHARAGIDWALAELRGPNEEIHRNLEAEVHRMDAELLLLAGHRDDAIVALGRARATAEWIGRASERPARFLEERVAETAARL